MLCILITTPKHYNNNESENDTMWFHERRKSDMKKRAQWQNIHIHMLLSTYNLNAIFILYWFYESHMHNLVLMAKYYVHFENETR